MNEREALEEIKFEAEFNGNDESLKRIINLCDQALAPKECDVTKCEYYWDEKCRCMNSSIAQDFYKEPKCVDVVNCYYKQLHSQEKTFTLEEVKEILENYLYKSGKYGLLFHKSRVDELFAEFEKESK